MKRIIRGYEYYGTDEFLENARGILAELFSRKNEERKKKLLMKKVQHIEDMLRGIVPTDSSQQTLRRKLNRMSMHLEELRNL